MEQPCENEEENGSEDSDEDPNRLLRLEVCHNKDMCFYTISNPALYSYMDDRCVAKDFVCVGVFLQSGTRI